MIRSPAGSSRRRDVEGAQAQQVGREHVYSPPALDVARDTIVLGASRGGTSTVFAIGFDGHLKWWRDDLGKGRFRNNPQAIDADGRIFLTLDKTLFALKPDGTTLWSMQAQSKFATSAIVAAGRLYVGTTDGRMYAIGGCPP